MPDQSTRYPEEIKELAYNLWYLKAGRGLSETARLLASGEFGEPCTVTVSTIMYWRDHYGWTERADADMQRLAGGLRSSTFAEMALAGPEAARYLREVVTGGADPDKTRVAASVALLDRIGFSPVGRNDMGSAITAGSTVARRAALLAELSDEELLERERSLGAGR